MNEMLKTLMERRSCRSYRPDPVPEEILDQILEAGSYAATGMGRQSPIMIAVTDKETRDRLSRMNAAVMGSTGDPFYGAPNLIVVLADRKIGTYLYDGSLVMGNLMNAAAGYVANDANFVMVGLQYNEGEDALDSDAWCIISYGKHAGSTFIGNFYELVKEKLG